MKSILDRARAYLARMPVSVEGQGGHAAAFAAALALVKGFNLGEQEALRLLMEWNAGCLPPWTESELRHKLRSAAASSSKPAGYLLGESDTPTRERLAPDFENEAEKKARQRKAWPEFKRLKPAGIMSIAELRHMLPDAVDLAHRWGFVRGAEIEGQRCFIIHEGTFAQARRLDGQPFTRSDGTKIKAKNLPGSTGAFIGQRSLGDTQNVLLVEGAIGFLEALAALALVNMKKSWSILAAASSSSRFARDPALLARLKGRSVRIIPDADEAGMDAAASWLADLESAGARADAMALPDGFKDLGEIIAAGKSHLETLNAIFQ
jgi:hypothetical protein